MGAHFRRHQNGAPLIFFQYCWLNLFLLCIFEKSETGLCCITPPIKVVHLVIILAQNKLLARAFGGSEISQFWHFRTFLGFNFRFSLCFWCIMSQFMTIEHVKKKNRRRREMGKNGPWLGSFGEENGPTCRIFIIHPCA